MWQACRTSAILRAEMPEDSDFLCGGWIWDSLLRELRFHVRTRKGWKDEPEQVERLQPVRSVTWLRWSQAPLTPAQPRCTMAGTVVGRNGSTD